MSQDIVDRLRDHQNGGRRAECEEAAAEIERLRTAAAPAVAEQEPEAEASKAGWVGKALNLYRAGLVNHRGDEYAAMRFVVEQAFSAALIFYHQHVAAAPQKVAAAQEPVRSPIEGEKFVRGWLGMSELPGGMMTSSSGRFGPVPASTSTWVTTSESERDRMAATGPVLEVWVAGAAPQDDSKAPAADAQKPTEQKFIDLEGSLGWLG